MGSRLSEIYDLLYRLGLAGRYTGFFHTSYAVLLCIQCPVERNFLTAGSVIWRENRPLLEELARGPLPKKPRPAQLHPGLGAGYRSSGRA